MKKNYTFIFFIFLISIANANNSKAQNFSTDKVRSAVRIFSSCVMSEYTFFDVKNNICGVDAENRTELRGYLSCPILRQYIFSSQLEVDSTRGRFLYSCDSRPDIVISIHVNEGRLVVVGIGELLP